MAVESKDILEIIKEDAPAIDNTYLQVKTTPDGYTGTYEGFHSYLVQKDGGEYGVYPIETTGANELKVFKKSPIIMTDGEEVHFVVSTMDDPFQHPIIKQENVGKQTKEHAVLQAFLAFASSRFSMAVYHIMIADGEGSFSSVAHAENFGNLVETNAQASEEIVKGKFDKNAHVQSVAFDKEAVEVNIGETAQLLTLITPTYASNKDVVLKSSRETVAKINSAGLVTAVAEGEAIITVTTADGKLRATSTVTVKPSAGSQEPDEPKNVKVDAQETSANVSAE